jgi:hypothetical protein
MAGSLSLSFGAAAHFIQNPGIFSLITRQGDARLNPA